MKVGSRKSEVGMGVKRAQPPTLNERAKKVLAPFPRSEPQESPHFVEILRQSSSEAFVLSDVMTSKGETLVAARFQRYARYMGKSARLIEDLAKEHLKRTRKPIANRKSKIANGRKGK